MVSDQKRSFNAHAIPVLDRLGTSDLSLTLSGRQLSNLQNKSSSDGHIGFCFVFLLLVFVCSF